MTVVPSFSLFFVIGGGGGERVGELSLHCLAQYSVPAALRVRGGCSRDHFHLLSDINVGELGQKGFVSPNLQFGHIGHTIPGGAVCPPEKSREKESAHSKHAPS